MHEMSLRASSTLTSLDGPANKDAFYSVSHSERSIKLDNDYGRTYHHQVNLDSLNMEQDSRSSLTNQTRIPNLRLSSSTSYTDKEMFSTPALELSHQKATEIYKMDKDYYYVGSSDVCEMKSRSMKEIRNEKRSEIFEPIRKNDVDDYANEKSLNEDTASTLPRTDVEKSSQKKEQPKFLNKKNEERRECVLSKERNYETKFLFGVSSSVARIQTKRNFRKKIRPFAGRVRKRQKDDQRSEKIDVSSFR
ncbi:hypothetical protein KPH14_003076 [Odynerus spinipes]|uniref:Uncharacterized protein n=1 Tax=Odynerus spinipes TaxID=1348599 RepID=A0AAD9VUK3_9HYME|nr:hypothetical protein KPH14_003076 [Odynerus spinipes]